MFLGKKKPLFGSILFYSLKVNISKTKTWYFLPSRTIKLQIRRCIKIMTFVFMTIEIKTHVSYKANVYLLIIPNIGQNNTKRWLPVSIQNIPKTSMSSSDLWKVQFQMVICSGRLATITIRFLAIEIHEVSVEHGGWGWWWCYLLTC